MTNFPKRKKRKRIPNFGKPKGRMVPILDQDDFNEKITVPILYQVVPILDQDDFNEKIADHPENIVKGVFLYTDEDKKLQDYIKEHFDALDELTGDWCKIYVLEKKHNSFSLLGINNLFHSPTPNKNEAYKIAEQLQIPYDQLPCLVFLPPSIVISAQEKLIIPIKDEEISPSYFRGMFEQLNNIVKQTEEVNRYEEIQIKFDTIVQYLEEKSQKVSTTRKTEYIYNKIVFVRNEHVAGDAIKIRDINNSKDTTIGREATATVNNINKLQNSNNLESQKLADLLKQLQAEIEKEDSGLIPKNRGKALKHLKTIGEFGDDCQNSELRENAETALDALPTILNQGTGLNKTHIDTLLTKIKQNLAL